MFRAGAFGDGGGAFASTGLSQGIVLGPWPRGYRLARVFVTITTTSSAIPVGLQGVVLESAELSVANWATGRAIWSVGALTAWSVLGVPGVPCRAANFGQVNAEAWPLIESRTGSWYVGLGIRNLGTGTAYLIGYAVGEPVE